MTIFAFRFSIWFCFFAVFSLYFGVCPVAGHTNVHKNVNRSNRNNNGKKYVPLDLDCQSGFSRCLKTGHHLVGSMLSETLLWLPLWLWLRLRLLWHVFRWAANGTDYKIWPAAKCMRRLLLNFLDSQRLWFRFLYTSKFLYVFCVGYKFASLTHVLLFVVAAAFAVVAIAVDANDQANCQIVNANELLKCPSFCLCLLCENVSSWTWENNWI